MISHSFDFSDLLISLHNGIPAIDLAILLGIIQSPRLPKICIKCGHMMTYYDNEKHYRCRNRKCNNKVSIWDPLPRSHGRISDKDFLLLYGCFCKDITIENVYKITNINKEVCSLYYKKFRSQAVTKTLYEMTHLPLGSMVQIDESLFTKRKANKGRKVAQKWVFGACDSNPGGRCYFTTVPKRNEENLLRCIGQWVIKGSIVVSDEWAAYRHLIDYGYFHFTVNHSKNFVNPLTGFHTQRIESLWGSAKNWKRKHGYKDYLYLQDYLLEFCYRHNHQSDFLTFMRNLYH